MFWTLMKKEFLQHLYSQKFSIMVCITVLLMLLSIFVSHERYRQIHTEYDRGINKQRDAIGQYETKNDNNNTPVDYDTSVFRKPTPLAVICHGMEYRLGPVANLDPLRIPFLSQPYGQMNESSDFDIDDSLDHTLQHFDFIMVVKILLSLMAIFMAFDLISGEREQNTLKLIFSNHVSRSTVLLSKICAGVTLLTVILLIGFVTALLVLLMMDDSISESAFIVRLGLLALASVLYLLVFYLGALCISSMIRSSHMTVITMFLVWVILLFVIPTVNIMIGTYVKKIPSPNYLGRREREINMEFHEQVKKENASNDRNRLNELREENNKKIWRIKSDYLNQLHQQQRFVTMLGLLSPATSFDTVTSYFAGTSIYDYDIFMDHVRQVNAMYAQFVEQLNSKRTTDENIRTIVANLNIMHHASLEENRLHVPQSLERVLPFFSWLMILNGLLLLLTIIYFNRKASIL